MDIKQECGIFIHALVLLLLPTHLHLHLHVLRVICNDGEFSHPEEVAKAVLFLASNDSSLGRVICCWWMEGIRRSEFGN